jgi:hypothetical protein
LIVDDTFTGATGPLSGHTPDVGAMWTTQTGTAAIDGAGYVVSTGAAVQIVQDIGSVRGTIEAIGQVSSTGHLGVLARTTSTSARISPGYFFNATPSASNIRLLINTSTIVGSANRTSMINTDYTLRAKVSGGTVGIWINGVLRIDIVDNSSVEAVNSASELFGLLIPIAGKFDRVRIWDQ